MLLFDDTSFEPKLIYMNRLLTSVLVLGVLLSAGCESMNTWGTTVPMGGKKYEPVPIESVMILFEAPSREYDQIGLVSSIGGVFASDGDMFKKMQKEAAQLGADAIIIRTGDKHGPYEYPKTNAIAIKYRQK